MDITINGKTIIAYISLTLLADAGLRKKKSQFWALF